MVQREGKRCRDPRRRRRDEGVAIGVSVGVAVGTALGVAMDDLALGLAIGLPAGAFFGVAVLARRGTDRDDQS